MCDLKILEFNCLRIEVVNSYIHLICDIFFDYIGSSRLSWIVLVYFKIVVEPPKIWKEFIKITTGIHLGR